MKGLDLCLVLGLSLAAAALGTLRCWISSLQGGRRAALGAIPYRRPQQRPALVPAELSEEEAMRIARIFSARLCEKE